MMHRYFGIATLFQQEALLRRKVNLIEDHRNIPNFEKECLYEVHSVASAIELFGRYDFSKTREELHAVLESSPKYAQVLADVFAIVWEYLPSELQSRAQLLGLNPGLAEVQVS